MYFSNAPFKVSLLAAAIALTGCGGDSSSSGGSDDPKDGGSGSPVNGFTMSAQGGEALYGDGGNGGHIAIAKAGGPSLLNIKKEGLVDASYSLPAQEVNFGTNPVTISEPTPVLVVLNDAIPLAGTLYMVPGESRLYRSSGVGAIATDDQEVTGIQIEAAGELILPDVENNNRYSNNTNDATKAVIYVRNDIQNDGKILTAYQVQDSANDPKIQSPYAIDVNLYAAAYYGSGSIDTAGNSDLYTGQKGGDIRISAHTIQNSGLLNAVGAAGEDKNNSVGLGQGEGGQGGDVELSAEIFVENTGEIRTSGGVSEAAEWAEGGAAGDVSLSALEVYNTATITADHGPSQYLYYRNNGADIDLIAGRTLINTGALSAKGAQSTGDNGNWNAGHGGSIELLVEKEQAMLAGFDGRLVNTGDLNVDGGSVTKKSTGDAGNGGEINIGALESMYQGISDVDGPHSQSQVAVSITGNVSAKGGDTAAVEYNLNEGGEGAADYRAGDGGQGGTIVIYVENTPSSTTPVNIVGYESTTVNGGSGMDGATAGDVMVASTAFGFEDYDEGDYDTVDLSGDVPALAGPLSADIDVHADGGSAQAGSFESKNGEEQGMGGSAGSVAFMVVSPEAYLQPEELSLEFNGNINANGGRSYDSSDKEGATGGEIAFIAPHNVTVNGALSLNGGAEEHVAETGDVNHEGADAGFVSFVSFNSGVSVDAEINANGGNGTLIGGDAGGVAVTAETAADVAGVINLNGGDSAASDVDGFNETEGGDAGSISILSGAYNSELSATVKAEAGTGDEIGEDKVIYVDADCQSDNCGVSPDQGPRAL